MKASKLFSLTNRVVVITGGYGHLGRAMVEAVADAGAVTIIAGRDGFAAHDLAEAHPGGDIHFVEMDIASTASIREAFAEIHDVHGPVYGLVNNAYYGVGGSLDDMDDPSWAKGLEGAATATFTCIREALPHMEGGSIVNVASMYGMVAPHFEVYDAFPEALNPPNYGAGKAAVLQLTRYAAAWLAKRNIRVNALSPGAFPSPEVQENEAFIRNLETHIPLGRIGAPRELAGAVLFLLSQASSYMTGQNLVVDGGWTCW